jgi:restriction system protein
MSVPSFQQLMLPTLQTIGQRYDEISIGGLEDEVVKTLRISPEERSIMLPSGNQRLISNRLNWARSYLSKVRLTSAYRSDRTNEIRELWRTEVRAAMRG